MAGKIRNIISHSKTKTKTKTVCNRLITKTKDGGIHIHQHRKIKKMT